MFQPEVSIKMQVQQGAVHIKQHRVDAMPFDHYSCESNLTSMNPATRGRGVLKEFDVSVGEGGTEPTRP